MAKKKIIPEYSKVKKNGTEYYRTRILDADGKQVDIYGKTCEEVYDKAQTASRAIAEAIFRKNNPTVREYCEKWLKMKSATVRPNTLEGYRKAMEKLGTDSTNTIFVGDQIFTDVMGANIAGIRTILVKPIHPKEEIQIVLKRFLEKPVIGCYKIHRKLFGAKYESSEKKS